MRANDPASERPIRLLFVDDEGHTLKGLRRLIESRPDFELVGPVVSGETAAAATAKLDPDVVLMDYRAAGRLASSLAAHGHGRVRWPPRLVLLSPSPDHGSGEQGAVTRESLLRVLGHLSRKPKEPQP